MFSWTKNLLPKIVLPLKKIFVPRIAFGLSSVKGILRREFNDVETVHLKDLMLRHLNGDQNALTKMSPKEITELANTVLDEAKATGIVFPGDREVIPEFLWNKNAKVPWNLNAHAASSIFKMAQTRKALTEQTPSLHSCDGTHYPVVTLNGEVSRTPTTGSIQHGGMHSHDIAIKNGTWLEEAIKEIPEHHRNGKEEIVVRDTPSTHTLWHTKIPNGVKILATTNDGAPCILSFHDKSIGVLDHPEVCAVNLPGHESEFGEGVEIGVKHNTFLWQELRKKFLSDATPQDTPPQPPSTELNTAQTTPPQPPSTIFNHRVEEILNCRNIAELSATRISLASPNQKQK